MKIEPNCLRSFVAAAALLPVAAYASLAVTTQGVNMRAGPDASYPRVAALGGGVQVDVVGCVQGWQWCDVIAGPNRGWVYAQYLSYYYNNVPTPIYYGGPALGIPLISFSIGPYWDDYYRGRPWWNNRTYWYNHRIATAPEWRPPANWHGNEWRGNSGRGNEYHGNYNHGNEYHGDNRGNPPRGNPSVAANPDHFRPNDQFHPNEQQ